MTVHLREKGWREPGEVVHCTPEVLAQTVEENRLLRADNARRTAHSAALFLLVKAIQEHGVASEQFDDAYRDAQRAIA